jgi:hypothetical protein
LVGPVASESRRRIMGLIDGGTGEKQVQARNMYDSMAMRKWGKAPTPPVQRAMQCKAHFQLEEGAYIDSSLTVIIRGTFSNKTFVPADPLPEAEGPAELIVHVQSPQDALPSIYDAFGKAKQPQTAEELDARLEEERVAWGSP